jgi:hypothetical protein
MNLTDTTARNAKPWRSRRRLLNSLNLNADLAHTVPGLEALECRSELFQGEAGVDHRPQGVRLDGADHLDLVAPAADGDRLQPQPLRLHDGEGAWCRCRSRRPHR